MKGKDAGAGENATGGRLPDGAAQRGKSVLVTGAAGFIGSGLVRALAARPEVQAVVALDVRPVPEEDRVEGVVYRTGDVRRLDDLTAAMEAHAVDAVAHLASIVTPGPASSRELEYAVDVGGTRSVLDACRACGVRHLTVTSSGAAYGYWPDNPVPLDEDDALRGNDAFPYARHKRLVEEMLAEVRRDHPALKQLVFRPGTVLGRGVRNQITALFDKPFVLGVAGAPTPFVLIWDEDVVACMVKGIVEEAEGVYNLAGDGTLTMRELARRLGRPYLPLPAWLLKGALGVLHPLGLARYAPEQVDFLRYRPVLSNRRLKEAFGYTPARTTTEVFEAYLAWRAEEGA